MSTENKNKKITAKMKEIWLKYEPKIVLGIGFLLVAVLAFEAGVMKGQKWQQSPLVIEKQAPSEVQGQAENAPQTPILGPEASSNSSAVSNATSVKNPQKDCPFLGSKNSDKYHVPSCSSAKRIKPENVVCFKDANEAANRGYLPDKCVTGK